MPTSPDPADGIMEALAQVTDGRTVTRVAFGTTHALNAILRRQGLRPVALVRLGAPGTEAIPPLAGWPQDLEDAVSAGTWIARGGVEIDGRHVALDPDELRRIAATIAGDRVATAIAIVGMFSPLDAAQEREAAALFAEATGLPVSIGSDIGGLGLLERENATVLNAALGDLVEHLVTGLEAATARLGEGVRAYLTQNDGTLMTLDHARRAPVLTIGAGPSNSLRGAALLSGRTDVLVIDVGGTSADVGALVHGFPRESAAGVEVGGVQTNFRMPDLVSVSVGGGTIVGSDGSLGLDSVGSRLIHEALVFGGATPTLDRCSGGERASGDRRPRARHRSACADERARTRGRASDRCDRPHAPATRVTSISSPSGAERSCCRTELPGIARVDRPADADVANAVGAALAPVAGEADFVADVAGEQRHLELDRAVELAGARAVEAGARPDALETIWIEEIPLAYVDRPVSRVRAKVAGPPADVLA